jgi:deoxyadenosine/deoxycytidine kinase
MKIGFCGTMSVGKTTLTKELVKLPQFKNYHYATERSKYLNSLGIPLNHGTTIEGQTVFLAERVTELMQKNIITDRTVIDVIAFTLCSKKVSYIDADAFEDYAKRFIKQYDHIFYVSPEGISMEDNGVRETDLDYRQQIDETIQKLLFEHRPIFHTISGSTEERIEQILKVIQE